MAVYHSYMYATLCSDSFLKARFVDWTPECAPERCLQTYVSGEPVLCPFSVCNRSNKDESHIRFPDVFVPAQTLHTITLIH